jgi:hypothetical protein
MIAMERLLFRGSCGCSSAGRASPFSDRRYHTGGSRALSRVMTIQTIVLPLASARPSFAIRLCRDDRTYARTSSQWSWSACNPAVVEWISPGCWRLKTRRNAAGF